MALGEDLVAHGSIQWAEHVLEQQGERIIVEQTVDGELGEPVEEPISRAGPRGAEQQDPLGEQAPSHEPEDLGRRVVQPLAVVHEHGKWSLVGDLGEQGQRRQSDHEPIGRLPCAPSEQRRQRFPLRVGQPVEAVEHRGAELVKAAVRQLDLGFNTARAGDVPSVQLLGHVAEQGALADPRVAAEHHHAALPGTRVGHGLIKCLALHATSQEPHPASLRPLDSRPLSVLRGRSAAVDGLAPGAASRIHHRGEAVPQPSLTA